MDTLTKPKDTIECKNLKELCLLFQKLNPSTLESVTTHEKFNIYVKKTLSSLKEYLRTIGHAIPSEFDFYGVLSAVLTVNVYLSMSKNQDIEHLGTHILPLVEKVDVKDVAKVFFTQPRNDYFLDSLNITRCYSFTTNQLLKVLPEEIHNHVCVMGGYVSNDVIVVFINISIEQVEDCLKHIYDQSHRVEYRKKYLKYHLVSSFSFNVSRIIFSSLHQALRVMGGVCRYGFYRGQFYTDTLTLFEQIVGNNIVFKAPPIGYKGPYPVINVRHTFDFVSNDTETSNRISVDGYMPKSINFLQVFSFLYEDERLIDSYVGLMKVEENGSFNVMELDRSEENINAAIRTFMDSAPKLKWHLLAKSLFKEKWSESLVKICDILEDNRQKRPFKKFSIDNYPDLFDYIKPFFVDALKEIDNKCRDMMENVFLLFEPAEKRFADKCDEKVKGLVNIGIPWENLRLLWLLLLKPQKCNKVYLQSKDIILLIERAYFLNEYDLAMSFMKQHILPGSVKEKIEREDDLHNNYVPYPSQYMVDSPYIDFN
jgi:hypothetical protein